MAKKQKEKKPDAPETPQGRRFVRYCLVLLLAGVVTLAWLSLLSFSPTDPPSPALYPPKRPVDNSAGLLGSHLAYWLRYWLGGGVYMGLLFASLAAVLLVLGGRITDVPWRIVGLALLIAATSAGLYLLDPTRGGDVQGGLAGIVGIGAGKALLAKLGLVGGWIILIVAFCIGLMLTADNLVLRLPGVGRKVLRHSTRLPGVVGSLRARFPRPVASGVTASPRSVAAIPATKSRQAGAAKLVARPAAAQSPTKLLPAKTYPEPAPSRRQAGKSQTPGGKAPKFDLPSIDLLADPSGGYSQNQELQAAQNRLLLQQTLNDFGIEAEVMGYMTGPVITLYELSVAPGVKVSRIASLATDIARALAVTGVRIVPPRFGKDTVGIEVPNSDKEIVRLKELMQTAPQAESEMFLPLYLGKDAAGDAIVADLAGMPHILIAGTTGSGKSVCINAIIMSMLMNRTPQEVRMILVDPKMVEMAAFENLPHLLCPIVNDMRKAEEILEWATTKMDERYEILKEARVRNIAGFNALSEKDIYERFGAADEKERAGIPTRLPHYVIIIDELADLMMTSSKEVEGHIIRIAQKARAVGIHLVLATQRPSVNVVTGLIKSNMPCRISFRVASRQESRIVLDQNGADVLLGRGDMLFLEPGSSALTRAQGAFVDESEVRAVVRKLRSGGEPGYNAELIRLHARPAGEDGGEKDPLFNDAVGIILTSKRGSVSLLQRRLQVGYSRASRIVDQMADAGILGDYKGSQARECLITLDDWEAMQASVAADKSGESSLDGEPMSV